MRNTILNFVKGKKYITFVDLEHLFKEHGIDYKGDYGLCSSPEYEHILYWTGWNKEAIDLISSLGKEGLIYYSLGDNLSYLIDGGVLNLPIAKKIYHYKTDHWLPVFINGKN